jgi:hypothetical protein
VVEKRYKGHLQLSQKVVGFVSVIKRLIAKSGWSKTQNKTPRGLSVL